jgi:leucyl-tRNA synthetase
MGPPELDTEWQPESIRGLRSFLNRLWAFLTNTENILPAGTKTDDKTVRRFHQFLKAFQTRVDQFKVNTAVSAIMEYLNDLQGQKLKLDHELLEKFLVTISIMVPHFSSELLEQLLQKQLATSSWPTFDEALAHVSEAELAVQVNGKLRATLQIQRGTAQAEIEPAAKKAAHKWLENGTIVKVIFVQDRLINFVIK